MMKKRREIFILEDSAIQRILLRRTLGRDDRKLIFAESIREAKEIYNDNGSDIDMFILDLKLPDGNGIDFLQYVRKSSNVSPAIITSAAITDKVKEDAEKLGIVGLFEKPIQLDEFNQTVSTLLPEKNYDTTQGERLGTENVSIKR